MHRSTTHAVADRRAVLLLVTTLACGDSAGSTGAAGANGGSGPTTDAAGGGAIGGSASTGLRGEATTQCVLACDHQLEPGCSGTPPSSRSVCVGLCERTSELTPEACLAELVVLQQCRASLAWACDSFGGSQPTSTCASESGACLQCAGTLCDALALEAHQP